MTCAACVSTGSSSGSPTPTPMSSRPRGSGWRSSTPSSRASSCGPCWLPIGHRLLPRSVAPWPPSTARLATTSRTRAWVWPRETCRDVQDLNPQEDLAVAPLESRHRADDLRLTAEVDDKGEHDVTRLRPPPLHPG